MFDGAIENMDVRKNMVAVTSAGRVAVLAISEINRMGNFPLSPILPVRMIDPVYCRPLSASSDRTK